MAELTDILSTVDVKNMLDNNPDAEFSLQPVKVQFTDRTGSVIDGYHIFRGHHPKMHHVKGEEIWTYVAKPY